MVNKSRQDGEAGCAVLVLLLLLGLFMKVCDKKEKPAPKEYSYPENYRTVYDTIRSMGAESYQPGKRSKKRNKAGNASSYYGSGGRATGNGRILIRGPRGGCYYINSNGNKVYVDRSLCD